MENDDIMDSMSLEIRRLEKVIKTLKECLMAVGVKEHLVAEIATEAYNSGPSR